MPRLGYTRYVAQGGDVGAAVTDAMGRQAPEGLIGIHTNLFVPGSRAARFPKETEEERAAAASRGHVQGDRLWLLPRADHAAADDRLRPAGLTGRASRRGCSTTTPTATTRSRSAFVDGKPSGDLTRDHILDNITLYWLTGTGASAARLVLGERASRGARGRSGPSAGLGPGRIHHVPGRDLRGPAQLGRAGLPHPRLLQQGRQGRPLRRLGGAPTLHDRDPRRIPHAALEESTTEQGHKAGGATLRSSCSSSTSAFSNQQPRERCSTTLLRRPQRKRGVSLSPREAAARAAPFRERGGTCIRARARKQGAALSWPPVSDTGRTPTVLSGWPDCSFVARQSCDVYVDGAVRYGCAATGAAIQASARQLSTGTRARSFHRGGETAPSGPGPSLPDRRARRGSRERCRSP